MNIEQVHNAMKALGLDPANTASVAIWDDRVVWETLEVREDGNDYTPHEARIDE